jgi:hypothetical protein
VEGTDEQLDTANIQFNFYNGSDTNDIKLTGFLSNLDETNPNLLIFNENGIYFDDFDDNDILGELDWISVAGDGDAGIQSGDYFQLFFVPNGVEMMGPQPL